METLNKEIFRRDSREISAVNSLWWRMIKQENVKVTLWIPVELATRIGFKIINLLLNYASETVCWLLSETVNALFVQK